MGNGVVIRDARKKDLAAIIKIDQEVSVGDYKLSVDKSAYWRDIFDYYVLREKERRIFLVAEDGGEVAGFIVGEARAWEFASPLCGWVFAVEVSPATRTRGIGQRLFKEICDRLRQVGVTTIRTMVDIDNKVTLSFYRSQGMRSGRHIELEMQI